jgi:transcriptional regulator with XRE-family HTH domain
MKFSRPRDIRHVYIGQRVRAARLRAGVTQAEVGARLGVTYQQINKYERGQSALTGVALLDLAALFRVEAGWLLGGESQDGGDPKAPHTRLESRMMAALAGIEDHAMQLLAVNFVEALTARSRPPVAAAPSPNSVEQTTE